MGILIALGLTLLAGIVFFKFAGFLCDTLDAHSGEALAMKQEAAQLGDIAQMALVGIKARIDEEPNNKIYQSQLRKSLGNELYNLAQKGGIQS